MEPQYNHQVFCIDNLVIVMLPTNSHLSFHTSLRNALRVPHTHLLNAKIRVILLLVSQKQSIPNMGSLDTTTAVKFDVQIIFDHYDTATKLYVSGHSGPMHLPQVTLPTLKARPETWGCQKVINPCMETA